jgi:hypothetical protein
MKARVCRAGSGSERCVAALLTTQLSFSIDVVRELLPRGATTGKNSADISLVVDAIDLSWSKEHIDAAEFHEKPEKRP